MRIEEKKKFSMTWLIYTFVFVSMLTADSTELSEIYKKLYVLINNLMTENFNKFFCLLYHNFIFSEHHFSA